MCGCMFSCRSEKLSKDAILFTYQIFATRYSITVCLCMLSNISQQFLVFYNYYCSSLHCFLTSGFTYFCLLLQDITPIAKISLQKRTKVRVRHARHALLHHLILFLSLTFQIRCFHPPHMAPFARTHTFIHAYSRYSFAAVSYIRYRPTHIYTEKRECREAWDYVNTDDFDG